MITNPAPQPVSRGEFGTMGVHLRIEPRWTDLDPAGHVTNSVYLVYAEEARARYLRAALPMAWSQIVVVHNSIDYHHPVAADDVVDVTCAVESSGTSSMTSIAVIATVDGRRCATVRTVQAVLGPDRKATRPWTEEERASIDTLKRQRPAGDSGDTTHHDSRM